MVESDFIEITQFNEIDAGGKLFIDINGKPIVIFKVGQELFAMDDVCTHDHGPIGEGELNEYQIVCPRHGARFDIKSGKALSGPAFVDIRTYKVRNMNGTIEINLLSA